MKKKWPNGRRFSPSSFIDLSLSLFPWTPAMRQTRKWGIVTPGNSFKIHKETKRNQNNIYGFWFPSHGTVWWTCRQLDFYHITEVLIVWCLIGYCVGNLATSREARQQGQLGSSTKLGECFFRKEDAYWHTLEPVTSPGWRTVPLPIRHFFHLVQPWVGLAVGKSKRFIGASDRYPPWSSVHHDPSFISPTCLLYQSQTLQNIWWLSKTQAQLEEQTLQSKNRHPRQSSAHLLPH